MDTVGQPLGLIREKLEALGIVCNIAITQPARNLDQLDAHNLYVIRQKICDNGEYQLLVAAKMRQQSDE